MSALEPIPFTCPGCGAKYEIVLIEPSPLKPKDAKTKCRRCGTLFPAADGNILLKYFLVTKRLHDRGLRCPLGA